MNTEEQSGQPALPLEIPAALKGRRIGLCGFDAPEVGRISNILDRAKAMPVSFRQQLLGDSLRVCDAVALKLANVGEDGVLSAIKSGVPILAIGPSQTLLDGTGAAYSWPRDFMNEPWSDAELLVRLFRMLEAPCRCHPAAAQESRMEPLVVLADGDPEMIRLVATVLRSDGITCQVAQNGLAALRLAREILPDLMLLDVTMPMLDGFEVLSVARCDPALQTLPVIPAASAPSGQQSLHPVEHDDRGTAASATHRAMFTRTWAPGGWQWKRRARFRVGTNLSTMPKGHTAHSDRLCIGDWRQAGLPMRSFFRLFKAGFGDN